MKQKKLLLQILAVAAILLMVTGCGMFERRQAQTGGPPPGSSQTVLAATGVMQDFVTATGRIPQAVLDRSAGIAVIPDLTRGAFMVGGEHGNGVLIRHEKGQWGLPVFMSIAGGSFGFQAGVTSTDLVLVFMNPASIVKLQSGSATLGADLILVAGPVGGAGSISTRKADVLSYKRTTGAFLGVALTGSVLSLHSNKTYAYYIRPNETQARGYYGGATNMLDADLLNLKQHNLQSVPNDARLMQQRLNQLTAAPEQ